MPRPDSAVCRAAIVSARAACAAASDSLRLGALGGQALDLDAQIPCLDVETSELAADALPAFLGALDACAAAWSSTAG